MRLICTFLLLYLWILNVYTQGLSFYGNEKRICERSSYKVFSDEKLPNFSKEIHLSFEYIVRNIESPGYIFLLKDKKSGKAYNFTYSYHRSDYSRFTFAEDGKKAYYSVEFEHRNLKHRWIPISLHLFIQQNRLDIRIDNDSISLSDIGLQEAAFSPHLYFGMCDHILETASFSIRHLSISNGEKVWRMPLNENSKETVHDSTGAEVGFVTKPVWLINDSYHWKQILSHYSSTPAGFIFNKKLQTFLIYQTDSFYTYHIDSERETMKAYAGQRLFSSLYMGMNFQDCYTGDMYAYELQSAKTVVHLSLDAPHWTEIYQDETPCWLYLHHHCGCYLTNRREFLLFGGYGNRSYSNTFLSYKMDANRWDTLHFSGDRITPRFFSGMTLTPDCKYVYIYGGKGNEAGNQDIGIEYFYDLYQLDLERFSVRRLWQQKPPTVNRVVSRDMVLSDDGRSIYFLGYPEYMPQTYVQLYRMDIESARCEALGDSIPITSEEIATNVNLHYNKERSEFYCSVQEFEKYGANTVRVYSLLTPPVSLDMMKHYEHNRSETDTFQYAWIGGVLMILAGLAIWFGRRYRTLQAAEIITEKEPELLELDIMNVPFKERNAICLFGTFTVRNRDGKDVSYLFSPKLRIIFLHLLLHSIVEKGVLSSTMNELFWPDKSDEKAKNLKGVVINHIRKILHELDGVELLYEKGRFRLVFGDAFYCDYIDYYGLIGEKKTLVPKGDNFEKCVKIWMRGRFLDGIGHEALDADKCQMDHMVISSVPIAMEEAYRTGNYMQVIRLCQVLFHVDSFNESALLYYVCACKNLGHSKEALKRYQQFVESYKKAMNEPYPVEYESISPLSVHYRFP